MKLTDEQKQAIVNIVENYVPGPAGRFPPFYHEVGGVNVETTDEAPKHANKVLKGKLKAVESEDPK